MNKLNKRLMVLIIALLLVTIGELVVTRGLIKKEPLVSYLRYETPIEIAKNYTIPPNAIAIQKVDSVTNAPIENATFDIEYIDERTIPPLGQLTANGGQQATDPTTYNANVELPNVVGTMVNANTYYFENYNNGWRNNNRTTRNSLAESYIPVDLSNLPVGKDYIVVVNYSATIGNRNDRAYAYTTKNTASVTYEDLTKHMFIDRNQTQNTTNVTYPVRTGNIYYLHFAVQKGNNQNTSTFQINSIHVYEARNYASYSFTNNNGTYTSNNRGVGGTCANSYVELDLTNYVGKYNVAVNATISSEEDCDWGYVTITESTDAPEHDQEQGRLFHVSGATSTNTYTTTLDAGKKYYIHMGYDKDKYTDTNNDRLVINSITVTLNTDDNIDESVTTDNEGIAYVNNAIAGRYRITETSVPNGYNLDSTPAIYEFDPANNDPFVITNVPKATLLVHHYEYGTTTSVSPDEVIKGTVGGNYTTSGKTNISGYLLDEDNLPTNANGQFNNGVIEITYYYNQAKNYTVEYYYDGTKDDTATDVLQKGLGKQVTSVQVKNKTGYKFDHNDNLPLTIVANENQNIIRSYYIIDPDQTKQISYTVNYYKDNTLVSGDTIQVIDTVQVLQPDTLTVDPSSINTTNKYNGYTLDRTTPSPIPGTVNDGDVISIYYKKRTDLSYTVYYKDADTDAEIRTAKVANNQTFETVILPANEQVAIEGYNYDSADKTQLVIGTGTNELTLYYTKRNDLSYIVNYLDKDTGEIIKTAKRVNNQVFNTVINSSSEVVTIDGYNYDSASDPSITIGVNIANNVINLYYTKRDDLSYTVNYLDKDTNEVIKNSKTVNNKTFKDIVNATDEVETIVGYNYDSASEPSITIGTGSNVLTLYYTKRDDLSYIVRYVDKDTGEIIKNDKTVNNQTFLDEIDAADEVVTINGYNYDSASDDPLTIRVGTNVLTLYYTKRNDLSYTVKYIDKDTDEEIRTSKRVNNQTFNDVIQASTEVIGISGYDYDSVSAPSITIGTGTNELIIYYTKVNGLSYTVKYVDKDTDQEIRTQKVVNGKTYLDEVDAADEVITIDGYNYDSVSDTTITIGMGTNELTIFYTKRHDLSYTVKYVDKDTNEEIKTSKRVNNQTFNDVITSSTEVVTIDGYNYDSVSAPSITIGTGTNELTIFYTKRHDLSYTVNYLDKDTDEVIKIAKTVNNKTFKDVVNAADEVETIIGYNYDSASASSITIGTGTNELTLYYTKRDDLSYTVRYIDKDANTEIRTAKTVNDNTYLDEIDAQDEVIAINGYNYDSVSEDTLVIRTGVNELKIFYTKRHDLSYTVRYVDVDTDEEIRTAKVVNNKTFNDVIDASIEVISLSGYDYDSVSAPSITIGTGTNELVIYYKKASGLSYTVKYVDKDTNEEIKNQKIVNGKTYLDVVDADDEVITIDGYNYDSVSDDTITIGMGVNELTIFYTKRHDLSYTVKYVDTDTDEEIKTRKTVNNKTFKDVITASTEVVAIDGYNYDSVSANSITIGTGTNELTIFYKKRSDLSYTVKYVDIDTDEEIKTAKVVNNKTFKDVVNSSTEVIEIEGYNYDSVSSNSITIGTGTNEITIFYTKRDDLSYTVNYYDKDTNEVIKTAKRVNDQTFHDVINAADEVVAITGYDYDSSNVPSITIGVNNDENIINLYYTKGTFTYTVKYYFAGVVDNSLTDVINATFKDEITTYVDKVKPGYELDRVEGLTLVISANSNANLIEVYYKKRSDLNYTVNYLEKNTNRVLHEAKVVNDVTFEEEIDSEDEIISIEGFNYDSVSVNPLVINVSGNVINIYYTKKTLRYKVEYYYNNVIDNTATENLTALFEDEIRTYTDKVKTGYKFGSTENLPLTIKADENQNVIKVFYVIDPDQVKTLSYTVEYYKDNVKVNGDTQIVTSVVQVLEPDTLTVDKNAINRVDKYPGYGFAGSDPATIPDTIATGSTIKIYYEIGRFPYRIEYYYAGVIDDNKTEFLSGIYGTEVNTYPDKLIDGYRFSRVIGIPLTISDNANNNIIKVEYEKRTDLSYTVNYLEQGTTRKIKESKVVDGQTFGTEIQTSTEKIDINGYNYATISTDTLTIGTGENVINIYYTKIGGLSYTVYYKELGTEETIHIAKEGRDKFFEDVVNASDERIDIEGYNYNSADHDSITIGTGTNELTLYYTKRNDLTYTINYLEVGTGRVLANKKVVNNARFKDEITAASQVIQIDGFNFSSADKDGIIIQVNPNENIINLLYTKRTDLKYTIKYVEKDIGTVLHADKVYENQTFEDVVEAINEVITISGYYYSDSDKDSITIGTDETNNVITLYYTKRSDLYYYVLYVDKDTGDEIRTMKEVRNNVLGSTIDTSTEIIDIDKYDYDSIDKTSLVISGNEDENIITIYYTKKISTVTIKYVDKYTDEVLDSITITDKVDTPYTSERKTIDGYTFIESDGDTSGNITVAPITVTYKYAINSKVIVKYVDVSTGNTITESVEIPGHQGKAYTTEKKSFDGYVFKEDTGNTSGNMGRSTIEVVYSYDKISQGVIERHIDASSGEVLYEKVHTGNVGDRYETSPRTFENYRIDSTLPDNANGDMTDSVILVLYKYHKASSVKVKYVDYYSNREIDTNTIYSGYESDTYNLANAIKTISGYTYDPSINDIRVVTLAHEPEEYIIYYKKNSSVVVKYIDEATDEVIDSDTITGVQGDSYDTVQKDIDGYEFSNSEGDLTGTLKENSTEVRYYYLYKTKVQVKYVDKNTGEELAEMVEHPGLELDNYNVTMDLKEIDGYTLVEEPEEKSGQMTKDTIVKTYYYSKNTEVEVQYIDLNRNEEIKESKVISGYEGKDYKVNVEDIPEYVFVEDSGNKEGQMARNKIVVKLKYAKEAKLVINYYDIKTNKIINTKELNSKEGDSYNAEAMEINGYDLVKENLPDNGSGKLDAGLNEVKYYYIRKTTVRVRKVDGNGNLLKPDVVIEGHEGDSYKIETELFNGYNLRVIPENKEGTMKVTTNPDGSANIETLVVYTYDEVKEDLTPKQETLPKTFDLNTNKAILAGGMLLIGLYMVYNLGGMVIIRPREEDAEKKSSRHARVNKSKRGKHSK